MQYRTVRLGRVVFAAMVIGVLGLGTASVLSTAEAKPRFPDFPHCPDVYAPVLCPNGAVYNNSCWASVYGQTNCVPFNSPGVEI